MATGGEGSSFDYDEYTEEPGGGRAHSRYVNTDTIHVSDSDDDRGMPQSPTEETLLSASPGDDSAATSGEHRAKDGHSSSDEEKDQSKSSGKMAKLFGKKKKYSKEKSKDKKDKKDKDNKKEKKEDKKEKEEKKEKKDKKEEKKEKKDKKEDKKEKKEEAKEKKEKKKKAPKEEIEKKDEEKDETDEVKEKEKPRDRSPHKMPGFGKLGGFFKRNKKDSNTSNDSDITPPKQTSTPPSHRFTADDVPRDISSDAPHDQTFAHSEHSGATSAAANSDVFDEPEKVPLEEMDPRARFRGPPPETIPMLDQPMGYVPPPMIPVSEAHVPPVVEGTTEPQTIPYSYAKGKPSISDKIRAPFNSILANKRSPKYQQGHGIAELNPPSDPPIARCSTFLVVVLVSGFILGIILTAMSSLSDTLAVVGPCFIGLSFFGLIGKIFFTLWWEEDPLPPLNKVNDQFQGFMKSGPNYQKDTYYAYPMYPVNSSQAALATYNVQSEVTEMTPMTNEMTLASDDVPDIGLRFTDSDMDYARDSSVPSHDDSLDAYKRMRKDSISSDENVQSVKPSFV